MFKHVFATLKDEKGQALAEYGLILALIAVGVVVYSALVWRLEIEGREDVAALLARLRGRFA